MASNQMMGGSMNKVVIFGAGKIADQAFFYLTNDSPYEVVAFTVDESYMTKENLYGLPVIPFGQVENKFPPGGFKMFLALGYQNLNKLRAAKYLSAKDKGYELISYVSSKASNFGGVDIGDNCFILENAVIQPGSKIGNNVYVWSGNHIGHHATIGDHCYISGQVVVSGNTVIEPYCFIGVNATIGHEITVGRESIVGAGCVITKTAEPKSVYIAQDTPKYRLDSTKFLELTKMCGLSG
jgi:sugar O-acyltransferase (sialic acid O-acetyltransferase NeuD family)